MNEAVKYLESDEYIQRQRAKGSLRCYTRVSTLTHKSLPVRELWQCGP